MTAGLTIPDLAGKRVLVTGASTGIGAALARALGEQGSHVAIHYNASREADPELVKLIQLSRESEDLEERAAVFAKIQRFVMENALSAPLAFQYELDALATKVKGYKPNLLGKPKYENISLG